MAKIPGLIQNLLPQNKTQPKIVPTQWIVHTAVDAPGPTNLAGYFERHAYLESHTWLRWDRHEQLMDTEVRADANYLANRRSDGTGAISTETEDDGDPVGKPWNAYQVQELIRTGVELNRLHGIPPRLPARHDEPGMGYHSLFPNHWTNVKGKTCPGPTRIQQFKDEILPGIRRAIDNPEEYPVKDSLIWFKVGNSGPHCYRVWGTIGKWMPTHDVINLNKFLGVPEANTGDKPLDKTWVDSLVLVDGPLANVAGGKVTLSAKDVAAQLIAQLR